MKAPERGLMTWFVEELNRSLRARRQANERILALADANLAVLNNRDAEEEADDHEHCYAEFHRCDGGGPGEAAKYTDNAD